MWLMVVLIWIQTGFAMVIFSSAIKAVPTEFTEAARIDGATESQASGGSRCRRSCRPSASSSTTLDRPVMKVFDIVRVTTGGQFGTQVIANQMSNADRRSANFGLGAALATLLFIAVLPVMYLQHPPDAEGEGGVAMTTHDRRPAALRRCAVPLPAVDPDVGAVAARRRLGHARRSACWSTRSAIGRADHERVVDRLPRQLGRASRSRTTGTVLEPRADRRHAHGADELAGDRPAGDDHPDRHRRVRRLRVRLDRLPRPPDPVHRHRGAAGDPAADRPHPAAAAVQRRRPPARSRGSTRRSPCSPTSTSDGTTTAVWLSHTAFGLPFAIFLLHNYISSLPRDLFEAARIDGADHFKIFWRLVLPLSVPVLAAFAIFQFLWTWNDYLVAVVMIGVNSQNWPTTISIANQAGEFGQSGAHPHRRCLHPGRGAARRVLPAPALLRARHPRRQRQGLTISLLSRCVRGFGRRRSGGCRWSRRLRFGRRRFARGSVG